MPDDTPLPRATPVPPTAPDSPAPTARKPRGCFLPVILFGLGFSLLANLILAVLLITFASDALNIDSADVREHHYLGERSAVNKIAVVKVDGLISEAGIAHPIKQLEAAARDSAVKAVVLRVDSPGGTVTASNELYECVVNLRDDTNRRFPASSRKPVIVSMGGVAASGGYYIATAGSPILAERTTITGSIGVFAALPNIAEFGKKNGLELQLIKAGDIKASGSFFHALSPVERQTWQDTVDSAYDTFLTVIQKGRPRLTKERMRQERVIDREIVERDSKGNPKEANGQPVTTRYTRTRADGGTFTAEQAKTFELVDEIGDLPTAIRIAAQAAGLTSYRAVDYPRPQSLWSSLTGMQAQPAALASPERLEAVLTPRLWFLAPSANGSILTTPLAP